MVYCHFVLLINCKKTQICIKNCWKFESGLKYLQIGSCLLSGESEWQRTLTSYLFVLTLISFATEILSTSWYFAITCNLAYRIRINQPFFGQTQSCLSISKIVDIHTWLNQILDKLYISFVQIHIFMLGSGVLKDFKSLLEFHSAIHSSITI